MPKSILFVDEEEFVQKALQRSFRKLRNEWDMRFATNPTEAAKALVNQPADVLITETVFSGQSGLDLLKVVREKCPQIVRIILSGYSDRDVILKSVDLAHQYLAKPCENEDLRETITRAFMMKDLLDQGALKKAVSKIETLPSLPSLYLELVKTLESEDGTIQKVGEIISRDISLTAKVLKLVNSSFFSLPQRVLHPAKAASLLGMDMIKAIVLTSGTFDQFNQLKFKGFAIEQLWDHATLTASHAQCIAQEAGLDRAMMDTVFMAGMLHDIGKLLVATYMPDSFAQILELMHTRGIPMILAEEEILGTSHAAIGAYLLGIWGLPEPIIAATAFHHTPGCKAEEGLNTQLIVHVACAFSHADPETLLGEAPIEQMDYACLEQGGCLDQLAAWRRVCGEKEL